MTTKTTKNRKKPKIQQIIARRKFGSQINHKLFSENFIYDPTNDFSKPI